MAGHISKQYNGFESGCQFFFSEADKNRTRKRYKQLNRSIIKEMGHIIKSKMSIREIIFFILVQSSELLT
jgi:hypothetical protein